MVQALGARLLDDGGEELGDGGGGCRDIATLDLDALQADAGIGEDHRGDAMWTTRCWVPTGAAAVFGPQKGAEDLDLAILERGLAHWADVVAAATGARPSAVPGAGSAGGVGFGAVAAARRRAPPGHRADPGSDRLRPATGRRRPGDHRRGFAGRAVAARARPRSGSPAPPRRPACAVIAVAGRSLLSSERLAEAGISAAYPLSELEPDVERSIANAAPLLRAGWARASRKSGST